LLVRSRRGWNMTDRLPELAELPEYIVLDGEIVAFNDTGHPHFPAVCGRVLQRDNSIAVTYVVLAVTARLRRPACSSIRFLGTAP
jgi:ATP-dependent DNA ligase